MNYIMETEELEMCRAEIADIDRNLKAIKDEAERLSVSEVDGGAENRERSRQKHLNRISKLSPFLKSFIDPAYL